MPRSLAPTSASPHPSSIRTATLCDWRKTSPRATKVRSRRMISPLRLVDREVHRLADPIEIGLGRPQQPQRGPHIIGGGGQRLVQLMRKCCRHLPHRAHARDMQEAILQFVQPPLGLLPLGEVADKAGEQARAVPICLADRQLHREGAAVLAPPDDHATDADDAPLASAAVALEIAVMLFLVRLRHQHPDVLAADLACRIAEQAFRG